MKENKKSNYGFAAFLLALSYIAPLMPHVVLKTPFWGILIYTALTLAGVQVYLNLPLFFWGLVVELKRAQFDLVFWLFIVSFILYVTYFVIAHLIPFINECRAQRMLKQSLENTDDM